jgi:glycosyltransferase involved in cell wall biosynthesis
VDIELSIIMPCLNEAETLAICINKARRFLDSQGINGEIVIGDNGSTDGSQVIAQQLGARVVNIPIRGYGAALYGAVVNARGKYCIMGDSDDSYDFSALEPFVCELRKGADLVMGNRFRGGIKPGAMPWKNRYIGNPVLSGIGRILFHCPASDFHCGLRGFSKNAFRLMDLRTTGMEFASEMVIKATLMKMDIREVPTTLRPNGRSRPPHLRPFRDGWRHQRLMMLFSPNWLFLYPGLVLMIAGLTVAGYLFFQPITIGHVRLGIDTMIYSTTAVEIGFQALLFSVLSKSFTAQEGLAPMSPVITGVSKLLNLEIGSITGALLVFAGGGFLVHALRVWSDTGFGALKAEAFSHFVVASSLLLSLGLEIIFSSFLLSVIHLNVRFFTPDVMLEK